MVFNNDHDMSDLSLIPNKFYEQVLHSEIVDGVHHKRRIDIKTTVVPENWRPINKEFTDKVKFAFEIEEKFK